MNEVLFASKAITPPWNDSGKNLVRDLARGLSRYRPTLMVGPQMPRELPNARYASVYAESVGFAPALLDQARVFAHLLRAPRGALWHFFFAPNARSCRAGRVATRLRRVKSVHTISSAPRSPAEVVPLLFADVNVVLSAHTERRLIEAGLAPDRIARIAPAIEPLAAKSEEEQSRLRSALGLPRSAPVVLYPGDLEFGEGAHLVIEAARGLDREVSIVLACRAKTDRARAAAEALRARVAALGLAERVRFVGETPRIHDWLACADIVALPSVDLYAKMDYPLVLLEAMSLARSVIVARGSAAEELSEEGAARAVAPDSEALRHAIAELLSDDGARASLGERGRRRVEERFVYTTMARAYEQLYDRLRG